MFKIGDIVIISKSDDLWFGKSGRITALHGDTASVSADGKTPRRLHLRAISAIPDNVAETITTDGTWTVEIAWAHHEPFGKLDKRDIMVLRFVGDKPAVSWGNGMVKIEGSNEMHLLAVTPGMYVRVHS